MTEVNIADTSVSSKHAMDIALKRTEQEQDRAAFKALQSDSSTLEILMVACGLESLPKKLGGIFDAVVIEVDEIRPGGVSPKRRSKRSPVWTDEAELLMSLDIGNTYLITQAVNDDGYVEWIDAECIKEAPSTDINT